MLAIDDKIHIAVLSVVDLFAIIVNCVYIFIIRRKTPKELSAYAILLVNVAWVDLISAFCSFMCIDRSIYSKGKDVFVYIGPCTLMNAKVCHFFQSFHAELLGQSIILLLASFLCRLYMFKWNSYTKVDRTVFSKRLRIAAILIAFYTACGTLAMFLAGTYTVPEISSNLTISALSLSGDLAINWLSRAVFCQLTGTTTFGFVSIFFIRRRLYAKLQNLQSNGDRYSHQHIYRSLTAQMLLPLAYLVGVSLWLLDVAGIVHSRTLQRTVITFTSVFPIASPLINMYYIPPYRKYLKYVLRSRKQIKPIETLDSNF